MQTRIHHVHFAATCDEPFPSLDTLPTIEVPLLSELDAIEDAVKALCSKMSEIGNGECKYARVIMTTHEYGGPHKVVQFPLDSSATQGEIWEFN